MFLTLCSKSWLPCLPVAIRASRQSISSYCGEGRTGKTNLDLKEAYICHFTGQAHTWFRFEWLILLFCFSLIRRIKFPSWPSADLAISFGVWRKKNSDTFRKQKLSFYFSLYCQKVG
jgi:hypothetical protein